MSLTHHTRKLPPPLANGIATPWGPVQGYFWDGFNRHVLFKGGEHRPDEMVREALEKRV